METDSRNSRANLSRRTHSIACTMYLRLNVLFKFMPVNHRQIELEYNKSIQFLYEYVVRPERQHLTVGAGSKQWGWETTKCNVQHPKFNPCPRYLQKLKRAMVSWTSWCCSRQPIQADNMP